MGHPKAGALVGLFVSVWLTGVPALANAATVYENTGNPFGITLAREVGDTVHLAGTERLATALSIGVRGNGENPAEALFRARLWTENAVDGTPDTLLWAGDYLDLTLKGPLELISFDIPFVPVPDVLIWTVDRILLSGDVLFQWSNPPTVGSSPDYAWAAGLRLDPSFGVPANFMARIDAEAVPEPGMAWALILGILILVCREARRRERAG